DLKDTNENQEESIGLQWSVHLVLQRDDLGEGKSFERVIWYSIGMVDPLWKDFNFEEAEGVFCTALAYEVE
ncbi:hypothetical protein Dimus_036097, partial [Dionaea muscipula]